MCTCLFSCRYLLSRIRFSSAKYVQNIYALKVFIQTRQMHSYDDSCSLRQSTYSNAVTEYTRILPHARRADVDKRLLSTSANTYDQFTSIQTAKLKALQKKKEAKRVERLAKQRVNELKRNVCILYIIFWIVYCSVTVRVQMIGQQTIRQHLGESRLDYTGRMIGWQQKPQTPHSTNGKQDCCHMTSGSLAVIWHSHTKLIYLS